MKIIILLCLCAIVAVSAVKQDVHIVSREYQKQLKDIGLSCAQEFNVKPIHISNLGNNRLPRDDATNKFLHCFAINSGFVDRTGHIIVDRVAGALKDHPRIEEITAVITKCSKITKENAVATTVANHICYSENSPVLFGYVA